MTIEVLDLASFQHPNNAPIDWAQVKAAGISAVIIKLTEGTSYVNPFAQDDVDGARQAGLLVAGYHFLHMNVDPVAQADFYLAHGGSDLPGAAGDFEVTDGQPWNVIEADMQRFHDHLAVQAGKFVLAYLNKSWVQVTGEDRWGWKTWLADPSDSSPAYPCVNWQYGTSPVPGIEGQVDRDRWVGSAEDFAAFFGSQPAVPAPAPAQPQSVSPGVGQPFSPDAPIVDEQSVGSAVWTLTESGAVYCVKGARYFGGANGQGYFAGRKAARLELHRDSSGAVVGYTVRDTANETYNYGAAA